MKDVAGDDYHIGTDFDDCVHRATEGRRNICLALIDARGRQPLELTKAQVEVGDMYEAQTINRFGNCGDPESTETPFQRAFNVRICCVMRIWKFIAGSLLSIGRRTTAFIEMVAIECTIHPRCRSSVMFPVISPELAV